MDVGLLQNYYDNEFFQADILLNIFGWDFGKPYFLTAANPDIGSVYTATYC